MGSEPGPKYLLCVSQMEQNTWCQDKSSLRNDLQRERDLAWALFCSSIVHEEAERGFPFYLVPPYLGNAGPCCMII